MQASKVVPGAVYAYRLEKGGLVRFRVTAVVTRRIKATGSPHDYDSSVEGHIHFQDGGSQDKVMTLDPKALLGPYEEQVELQERARLEDERREAEKKAMTDRADRLVARFFEVTGLVRNPENKHREPFRSGYGGDVDITVAGVQALLAKMEQQDALPEVGDAA